MEFNTSESILSKKLERQKHIHEKGFSMTRASEVFIDKNVLDYSKVKLGNGPAHVFKTLTCYFVEILNIQLILFCTHIVPLRL